PCQESADRRSSGNQLSQSRHYAAPDGDARLRPKGITALARTARRRFRDAARLWLLRRGHLGHRRNQRALRDVEPHGEYVEHAPQRRVLSDGARATQRETKIVLMSIDVNKFGNRNGITR